LANPRFEERGAPLISINASSPHAQYSAVSNLGLTRAL
jgi:hypothetical protein